MSQPWYKRSYLRHVLDMHITEWDERFLSQFDPQVYVDELSAAHVQSVVLYTHSHVGLCNFPTEIGHMHRGLKGRNIVDEVSNLCHKQGFAVVLYYSLIYDTLAYRNHPDWRIVTVNGRGAADESRYGVCCPNSPYRDYAAALAREFCEQHEFEGVRFDMTFWPYVCYCEYCRRRFDDEVGGELPSTVHWEDPHWVAFQRKREEWLADFAALMTGTVKSVKPDVSVEHQASTYFLGWRWGATDKLARHNDFLQGDFYGDAIQGSFARKLFRNLSERLPAAYETCIAVDLRNYTVLKSQELVEAKVAAALADDCAAVFIDAVDPMGTLNPAVYERVGKAFEWAKGYLPYLGGEQVQEVGVYLSFESKMNFADNGKAIDDPALSVRYPHVEAAVGASRALIDHHIPFGVITRKNLRELSRYRIIVLPNVLMMDAEEAVMFREYVRSGGILYASRYTSLITSDGRRQPDFLLADVFGVSCRGETKEGFTYIAPTQIGDDLLSPYTRQHPLGIYTSQMVVAAEPGAEILGTLTLPYTDPADPRNFTSIHNNPPGVSTNNPAIVVHRFGEGKAIYTSGELEIVPAHRDLFIRLLRSQWNGYLFQADAPGVVEVTAFHQGEKQRYLLSLVNFQSELPNVPVDGITVQVRLDGKTCERVLELPQEQAVAFSVADGYVQFTPSRLDTLGMYTIEYS